MGLWDRLLLGMHTQLGSIFVGLMLFLLFLGGAYFICSYFRKKRDRLAYEFESHYAEAESYLQDFTFTSTHKIDFFGRETVGKTSSGAYGLCRIPPPDLMDSLSVEKFKRYHRAMGEELGVHFAPYIWTCEEGKTLITIQDQLIDGEGRFFSSGRELLFDSSLSIAETENLLLDIAKGLAGLHRRRMDKGGQLYHGFLLPRSLFIQKKSGGNRNHVVIADTGMAYSLGVKKMFLRLEALRKGELLIDRLIGKDILEQLPMLAPEQKDAQRLREVGPGSDFYTFGAWAVSLFERKPFSSSMAVDWKQIPHRWHLFLKACLNPYPKRRPKDFLDLESWLYDPELALTSEEAFAEESSQVQVGDIQLQMDEEVDLSRLCGILDQIQSKKKKQYSQNSSLSHLLEAGAVFARRGRWKEALKEYEAVLEVEENHPEALLGVAIAHYELGSLEESEKFYFRAKLVDASTGKRFREHLASRT